MSSGLTIKVIERSDRIAMEQAWALRRIVFIEEQDVPEGIELDDDDAIATHVLATVGDTPIGCGRMIPHGDQVKIGRMAVLKERRREGIGRQILEYLMNLAREQGFKHAVLHAQMHAEGFYLKCGYQPKGEIFEEAGIPHRLMDHPL